MAISAVHHYIVRSMRENNVLPQGGAMLEIGQANWYNDLDPLVLVDDINQFVSEPDRRAALTQRLHEIVAKKAQSILFDVARVFYDIFYAPTCVHAIDFHGMEDAMQLDLNHPITLDRRYEVIINHGTAEHIFNIAQVFRTIHELTVPGGLMLHESPFTGWVEHGFYTLQPTLFYDLADFNQYFVCGMLITNIAAKTVLQVTKRDDVHAFARENRIPDNAMLFTVLRKGIDAPFAIPMQGYYGRGLSGGGVAAWNDLR